MDEAKNNRMKKIRVILKASYLLVKLLFILIVMMGMPICSFYLILLAEFSNDKIVFYSGMALTLLGLPLLFVSIIFRRLTFKIKMRLWCSFFALLLVPNIIKNMYKRYDQSFIRMSEASVEVHQYRPFVEGTKAVYLHEASDLTLTDPLPKLDGARALYPLYGAFAQAVYPKRNYDFQSEVGYTNTISAYERLIKRDADIIFVVSPSQEQRQDAKEAGVEIKLTAIGQDAFVFFVNVNNPVDNLTSNQVRDIYNGKITNWQQVGGKNQAVRAFQRNRGSGSQSAFLDFMQGHPMIRAPMQNVVQGMGAIIEKTADYANYVNSIGFSFRYFSQMMVANHQIKLLSIDGVYPSVESVASGVYPLTVHFYAATLADNHKPNVKRMREWMLSRQGQKLVEETGYIPVND